VFAVASTLALALANNSAAASAGKPGVAPEAIGAVGHHPLRKLYPAASSVVEDTGKADTALVHLKVRGHGSPIVDGQLPEVQPLRVLAAGRKGQLDQATQ
jgi:acyl CoA:acetate/3-ketoacid CoA transferase alpha subunit